MHSTAFFCSRLYRAQPETEAQPIITRSVVMGGARRTAVSEGCTFRNYHSVGYRKSTHGTAGRSPSRAWRYISSWSVRMAVSRDDFRNTCEADLHVFHLEELVANTRIVSELCEALAPFLKSSASPT